MRTNFADLAMGNAIFVYRADYPDMTEVGPHIRATYVLDDTPAGALQCDVWREVSMLSGEPALIWRAEYLMDGVALEPWQLQDMGLTGDIEKVESAGSMFDKWAAVRTRVKKESRRIIDWPTATDLHMDFRSWARKRGVPDDLVPSIKAFSTLVRNMDGVEPKRMGARGTHIVFLELIDASQRPAKAAVITDEVTDHEMRQAEYARQREATASALAAIAAGKSTPRAAVDPDSPWVDHNTGKAVKAGSKK